MPNVNTKYLDYTLYISGSCLKHSAFVSVASVMYLNSMSVTWTARVQIFLTFSKLLAIGIIIVPGMYQLFKGRTSSLPLLAGVAALELLIPVTVVQGSLQTSHSALSCNNLLGTTTHTVNTNLKPRRV